MQDIKNKEEFKKNLINPLETGAGFQEEEFLKKVENLKNLKEGSKEFDEIIENGMNYCNKFYAVNNYEGLNGFLQRIFDFFKKITGKDPDDILKKMKKEADNLKK